MTGTTVGPFSRTQLRRGRELCATLAIAGVLLLVGMIFAIGRGETQLYTHLVLLSAVTCAFGTCTMLIDRVLEDPE